jgi:hypothetical protein
MAFVKVVEGSEVYNFPIYHFVHFYSKFLSKTRSNVASPTRCVVSRRARARAIASVPARARRPRTHPPRPLLPHARAHAEDASRSMSPYHRAATRGLTGVVRPCVPLRRHRPSVRQSLGSTRATYKEKSPSLAHWSTAGAFSLSATPPLAPPMASSWFQPMPPPPDRPNLVPRVPNTSLCRVLFDRAALSPGLRCPRPPPPSSVV